MIAVILSTPANLEKLDHYVDLSRRLADPRKLTPAEADALIKEARIITMITPSLHATEVGAMQMTLELAYDVAAGKNERLSKALEEDDPLHRADESRRTADGRRVVPEMARHRVRRGLDAVALSPLRRTRQQPRLVHAQPRGDPGRVRPLLPRARCRRPSSTCTSMRSDGRAPLPSSLLSSGQQERRSDRLSRRYNLAGAAMQLACEERGLSGVISNAYFDAYWEGSSNRPRLVAQPDRPPERGGERAGRQPHIHRARRASRRRRGLPAVRDGESTSRTRGRAAGGGFATSSTMISPRRNRSSRRARRTGSVSSRTTIGMGLEGGRAREDGKAVRLHSPRAAERSGDRGAPRRGAHARRRRGAPGVEGFHGRRPPLPGGIVRRQARSTVRTVREGSPRECRNTRTPVRATRQPFEKPYDVTGWTMPLHDGCRLRRDRRALRGSPRPSRRVPLTPRGASRTAPGATRSAPRSTPPTRRRTSFSRKGSSCAASTRPGAFPAGNIHRARPEGARRRWPPSSPRGRTPISSRSQQEPARRRARASPREDRPLQALDREHGRRAGHAISSIRTGSPTPTSRTRT